MTTPRLYASLIIGGGGADRAARGLPGWFLKDRAGHSAAVAMVLPSMAWLDGVVVRAAYGISEDGKATSVGPTYESGGQPFTPEVDGAAQATRDGFGWACDLSPYRRLTEKGKRVIIHTGSCAWSDRNLTAKALYDRYAHPIYSVGAIRCADSAGALVSQSPEWKLQRYLHEWGHESIVEPPEKLTQKHVLSCGVGVLVATPAGDLSDDRLEVCYADPDRRMILRDIQAKGGEGIALLALNASKYPDLHAAETAHGRRWFARGWSIAGGGITAQDAAVIRGTANTTTGAVA